ncbi:LytTR family DNA-binding domain-containing protein [Pelomonas sp. SE-A7]|uniref:LytR/AlgR family response regulator transcription factor n=1 Tax=Pelomonas sp. SE-A7 TaxID=3054953 RepID=UPI00259D2E45|nr:LytTR family DNA-binding domain-containing protein [Pelomonas sp. SE-A7]MDM4767767.1 LytTR family DNA-binding domain-containing protein [Pelomonas sp. SE-A7]
MNNNATPFPEATALVAYDQADLRCQLLQQLQLLWPELHVVGEAADGLQALRLAEFWQPEIALLDVDMPGVSGLEVARQLDPRCQVVFMTEHERHAITAYEQGAVDCLLKPLTPARLNVALTRLRQRLSHSIGEPPVAAPTNAQPAPDGGSLRWISATVGHSVRLITIDEVLYFKSDHKYTRVVTQQGEALIRKSLKELRGELDQQQFWQIHRSTLVNALAVAGLTRDAGGHLRLQLKHRQELLSVADAYVHRFRQP